MQIFFFIKTCETIIYLKHAGFVKLFGLLIKRLDQFSCSQENLLIVYNGHVMSPPVPSCETEAYRLSMLGNFACFCYRFPFFLFYKNQPFQNLSGIPLLSNSLVPDQEQCFVMLDWTQTICKVNGKE